MHHGKTDRNATLVRGYAWHIYPDPATPWCFEGDVPFAVGDAEGPGRPPYDPAAAGVLEFWQVNKNAPGILNDHRNGNTYLAVTGSTTPPPVAAGWLGSPRPARRLVPDRPARWRRVHLVRIAGTLPTEGARSRIASSRSTGAEGAAGGSPAMRAGEVADRPWPAPRPACLGSPPYGEKNPGPC